jgi:hypothetical protein
MSPWLMFMLLLAALWIFRMLQQNSSKASRELDEQRELARLRAERQRKVREAQGNAAQRAHAAEPLHVLPEDEPEQALPALSPTGAAAASAAVFDNAGAAVLAKGHGAPAASVPTPPAAPALTNSPLPSAKPAAFQPASGPAPTIPVALLQPGHTPLAPAPTLSSMIGQPTLPDVVHLRQAPPDPELGEALFQSTGPLAAPSGGFNYRPRLVVSRFGADQAPISSGPVAAPSRPELPANSVGPTSSPAPESAA